MDNNFQFKGLIELKNSFNKRKKIKKNEGQTEKDKIIKTLIER